jgi:hypothetical protein
MADVTFESQGLVTVRMADVAVASSPTVRT